jgi:membrane protease YdiL (CAAX protease family)
VKKYGLMLFNILLFIGIYYVIIELTVYFWQYTLMPLHPWFREHVLGVIVLNDVIALPLLYLTYRYILKRNFFREARFHRMSSGSIFIACTVGLMAGIFTAMFARLPYIQSDQFLFQALFSSLNDSAWYVFLAFLLIGNLFKEVLFRALLFNELRKVLPLVIAIILQGLLYGALFFNFDPPLTLYGFLGAVVFVLLYIWFNSIWAPILAQILCCGTVHCSSVNRY